MKNETFYHPIGGGIEFGELAAEAVIREFLEELNSQIEVHSLQATYEEVFEFEGKKKHEITFMFNARFSNLSFYQKRQFIGDENGNPFKAM